MSEPRFPLTAGGASGSELIDRPKGGEAVPVRAKRVTGIKSRAEAACPSGFAGGHGCAAGTGKEADEDA